MTEVPAASEGTNGSGPVSSGGATTVVGVRSVSPGIVGGGIGGGGTGIVGAAGPGGSVGIGGGSVTSDGERRLMTSTPTATRIDASQPGPSLVIQALSVRVASPATAAAANDSPDEAAAPWIRTRSRSSGTKSHSVA